MILSMFFLILKLLTKILYIEKQETDTKRYFTVVHKEMIRTNPNHLMTCPLPVE